MNLGNLEFKAEDLRKICCCAGSGCDGTIAEELNQILRERLEKAPVLRQFEAQVIYDEDGVWYEHVEFPNSLVNRTARLVCIQEIAKKD